MREAEDLLPSRDAVNEVMRASVGGLTQMTKGSRREAVAPGRENRRQICRRGSACAFRRFLQIVDQPPNDTEALQDLRGAVPREFVLPVEEW
jgi:hypothetical protein